ncbi:sensor histidine kinase [Cohnella suwonensis]|uniref:Sensor histidine kinase n=1 Tax=Cohnella suwonensis TaxID=696072 RepID=A0ABW0LZ81_9BACL
MLFRTLKPQRFIHKAILFVIVFLIVPMLLIFWFASDKASLAIQQQAGTTLSELSKQNHITMDKVMDSVDQTTVSILRTGLMQSRSEGSTLTLKQRLEWYAATEKLLKDASSQVKYSLFVVTENSSDYYFAPTTDVSEAGVFFIEDLRDKPWLQDAVKDGGGGSVKIIEPFGFNLKPQKTVAYVRAVIDLSDGSNTRGILVATGIESVLRAEMNSIALPVGTKEYLIDARGNVLAGSQPVASTFFMPQSSRDLLPNVFIANSHMYIYHDSVSYANRLVYDIPLDSLIGSHRDVQEIIRITALCYFIVILIFLFYFGRSFLHPMARLASLTRSYEPGARPMRFNEAERKDEIGHVYRSFYTMTERLNQLIEEKYVMEIKQKESELMLMHSQITPHLLYNTLDSIYWYGIRGGVPEVADMVRDLSALLRIGLSRGKEVITIREELNHVQAYLHLQEKRYQRSFQFHIEAEESIGDYLLPKVILQPLVENSILHGVGKMDGEGEIWIDIQLSEPELLIIVEDNGFRPVDFERIESLLEGTANVDRGFGIRNVHKRIQLRYGDEYGLAYSARKEGGVKASIRLPAIRSLDESPISPE